MLNTHERYETQLVPCMLAADSIPGRAMRASGALCVAPRKLVMWTVSASYYPWHGDADDVPLTTASAVPIREIGAGLSPAQMSRATVLS